MLATHATPTGACLAHRHRPVMPARAISALEGVESTVRVEVATLNHRHFATMRPRPVGALELLPA
jgi:hypothetical protein